jgi:4-diphosphocytidyl-2-C-methyl-D-erythritol kinase
MTELHRRTEPVAPTPEGRFEFSFGNPAMDLERDSFCKVNLLLNVLGKRSDGFHALETLMHPVPLHDRLSFLKISSGIQLSCSDPNLPTNAKNLVWRAAAEFFAKTGIAEGVEIYLWKRIPVAAGLGGGSGNAAATLLALNELFGQPLDFGGLNALAASLGSDIPFFLQWRPALATGRGEEISPLDFFPALRGAFMVLVHPGFGVSTPWAYQSLANFPEALGGKPGRAHQLIEELQGTDLRRAGPLFYNALEFPVFRKYPLLGLFKEFFLEQGVPAALMSGSGSTVFALERNRASAEKLLESFETRFGPRYWTAVLPLEMGA